MINTPAKKENNTNVGYINIGLVITENIKEQISQIADKSSQRIKEKFGDMGDKAGASFEEKFNASINKKKADLKSLEKQLADLEEKLNNIESGKRKEYGEYIPDKDSLNRRVGNFLDNDKIYQKTLEQAEKLDEKIRLSKEKLSYDIEAYNEKTARSRQRAAEKQAARREKAAQRINARQEKTKKAASGSLKGYLKSFESLAKSIKRSFKSVFLMTGIYAAFKTLKGLFASATADSKKFTDSLNTVKANLLGAFTPIVSAVMPLLEKLMSALAAITTKITSFIAGLFGKTYSQVMSKTKKLQGGASSSKGGSLASFDQINRLSSSSRESSGGIDWDAVDKKGSETAEKLGEKFAKIKEYLEPINTAFQNLWQTAGELAGKFFDEQLPRLMPDLSLLLGDMLLWVRDNVRSTINFVTAMLGKASAWLDRHIGDIQKFLTAAINFWQKVAKPVLDAGVRYLLSRFESVAQFIAGVVDGRITLFTGLLNFLTGIFTADWKLAWQGLKDVVRGVANIVISMLESLLNRFVDVINGIINVLNSTGLAKALKEHTSFNGFATVGRVNFERIPAFAGGVITAPTLGLIGEYSGAYSNPEIVAPQSLMLETFTQAVEPLIAAIKQLIENGSQGSEIHIHLDASLSAFARYIKPYLDEETKRRGTKIILET